MNEKKFGKLILGITLIKIISTFAEDEPTREYFSVDRIQSDTGINDNSGFVTAYAGNERIRLTFGKKHQNHLEVEADILGNGALKTLRRIKNEYLPAHYPMIKIIERTIVTNDPEITEKNIII